ncbi:hypothetical protein A0H76_796 [Hepatospora eriocheir]|uniref:Uncharacterized protein n=1 Tax=Hepatospora eriocheir TaxID=1081669 RepID=A0A1X0Q6R8_9MICR|nr:hypothetical protein A0H76_796 [Hepatospora eriocheir]
MSVSVFVLSDLDLTSGLKPDHDAVTFLTFILLELYFCTSSIKNCISSLFGFCLKFNSPLISVEPATNLSFHGIKNIILLSSVHVSTSPMPLGP